MDKGQIHMQTLTEEHKGRGIVYRIACQNPGCGHTFDLRITAREAGMLAGTIACPRCTRHGGILKPTGRLGDKMFAARLIFKSTGVGPSLPGEEGDLLTDIG
jgi:hypothetical protein